MIFCHKTDDLFRIFNDIPDKDHTTLTTDSRLVGKGDVFVALPGCHTHGLKYAKSLLDNGAAVICDEKDDYIAYGLQDYSSLIRIENLDAHKVAIADWFYRDAISSLKIIGITGTNGKTTSAYFTCGLLDAMGERCGYIGTLGCGVYGEDMASTGYTTPGIIDLYRCLSELFSYGCTTVVMEISSHSIALNRISGIDFVAAAFTNLSCDHLDFHGTMDAYRNVKFSFFKDRIDMLFVINTSNSYGRELRRLLPDRIGVTFGNSNADDISISSIDEGVNKTKVNFLYKNGKYSTILPVTGSYNVENFFIAVGLCLVIGYEIEDILIISGKIESAPGRMQIFVFNNIKIIIDYAHTPDGVEKILNAVPAMGSKRVVFGCGGDRDFVKRADMGRIVENNANQLVLTDDNVRGDHAEYIINNILDGIKNKKSLFICRDRYEAVKLALRNSTDGDVVFILGKGNELTIQYGSDMIASNDIDIVRGIMRA